MVRREGVTDLQHKVDDETVELHLTQERAQHERHRRRRGTARVARPSRGGDARGGRLLHAREQRGVLRGQLRLLLQA